MYDFGSVTANSAAYGTATPPTYKLGSIKTPIYLFGGEKDAFSVPVDLNHLIMELETAGVNVTYKLVNMGHGDYVWASDAYTVLYPELIQIVDAFKN
jgi:lysosomal acid lipase/cholesteryl ester hydrolase